jgi:hypothetical protein
MDISSVLKKHSKIPFGRIRIVRKFEDIDLRSLDRAVIFIFAAWSGPAIVAFEKWTTALATLELGSLDLVVLDIDCLSPEQMVSLWGKHAGGGGETIWIRDGEIAARALSFYAGTRDLVGNTVALLQS